MKQLDKNWLEWSVFGISLCIVVGILGFLTYESFTRGDTPPEIAIELGAPLPAESGFRVPVTMYNAGDGTAEEVMIEVTLASAGAEEISTLTVAFLPRHTSADGWVVFANDPGQGTLTARVVGYEEP